MLIDYTKCSAHVHGQVLRPGQINYETTKHSSRMSTDHCSDVLGLVKPWALGGLGRVGAWGFLPRGVLVLVNFACFALTRRKHYHCNAMRKTFKTCMNWHTIQQFDHTPVKIPVLVQESQLAIINPNYVS